MIVVNLILQGQTSNNTKSVSSIGDNNVNLYFPNKYVSESFLRRKTESHYAGMFPTSKETSVGENVHPRSEVTILQDEKIDPTDDVRVLRTRDVGYAGIGTPTSNLSFSLLSLIEVEDPVLRSERSVSTTGRNTRKSMKRNGSYYGIGLAVNVMLRINMQMLMGHLASFGHTVQRPGVYPIVC